MNKRLGALGVLALMVASIWVVPAWADSDKQKASIRWFEDHSKVDDAVARLRRNSDGVGMRIKTKELEPGNAFTAWWVVFNDPDECSGDCGEDDLGDEDVGVTVAFAAGGLVADDGGLRLEAFLQTGDTSGALVVPGFLHNPGLDDPDEAEIHLVIRDHGPALEDQVYEQTHTFGGGCSGMIPPGSGDPGPNECIDQQYAVFEA